MDAYLFTGSRRFLNAGRSLAVRTGKEGSFGAQNVANVASRSVALMKGYEATGDRRWLETSKGLLETLYAWQDGDIEKLRRLAPRNGRAVAGEFQGRIGQDPLGVWRGLERVTVLPKAERRSIRSGADATLSPVALSESKRVERREEGIHWASARCTGFGTRTGRSI